MSTKKTMRLQYNNKKNSNWEFEFQNAALSLMVKI